MNQTVELSKKTNEVHLGRINKTQTYITSKEKETDERLNTQMYKANQKYKLLAAQEKNLKDELQLVLSLRNNKARK